MSKTIRWKRILVLIILSVFLVVFSGYVSLAYFTYNVNNSYSALSAPLSVLSIVEDLNAGKKVWISNDGNFPVYARVSFVVVYRSIANPEEIIPAEDDVSFVMAPGWDTDWYFAGGHYYHKNPLAPWEFSSQLLEDVQMLPGKVIPSGFELEVKVLADAIQSEPGDAVIDAWGFKP